MCHALSLESFIWTCFDEEVINLRWESHLFWVWRSGFKLVKLPNQEKRIDCGHGRVMEAVPDYTYLGTFTERSGKLDSEILNRISKAYLLTDLPYYDREERTEQGSETAHIQGSVPVCTPIRS